MIDATDARDALELEGLALAAELVRIAAGESREAAPGEAEELDRVLARLEAHRDGRKHIHTLAGVQRLWDPDDGDT